VNGDTSDMSIKLVHNIHIHGGAVAIAALISVAACNDDGESGPPGPGENIPAETASALEIKLETLDLPPNFTIELYTAKVPKARSIAVGPPGVVFVGSAEDSRIHAVIDEDLDRRVDQVVTIDDDLDTPNGVAYHDGDLYVAETGRVLVYPDIMANMETMTLELEPTVIVDTLPTEEHHGRRYIAFGPDGFLYIGIGVPCDACEPEQPIFGTIARMRPDGSDFELYATGVRNSVGFDWHPETGELWFSDNGRDGLGDNLPPDELNRAPEPGLNFGFPYCHGGFVLDPEFGEGRSCGEFADPVARLGPHVGALGIRFYDGDMFPELYRNNVIVAEHGSWDRSVKIGYRVMTVLLAGNEAISIEPLVDGFIESNGDAWGRPVDVAVLDDGSLLVSDDLNGALYRVSYAGS
jgi:glucose/arabinose dehydrogenase